MPLVGQICFRRHLTEFPAQFNGTSLIALFADDQVQVRAVEGTAEGA